MYVKLDISMSNIQGRNTHTMCIDGREVIYLSVSLSFLDVRSFFSHHSLHSFAFASFKHRPRIVDRKKGKKPPSSAMQNTFRKVQPVLHMPDGNSAKHKTNLYSPPYTKDVSLVYLLFEFCLVLPVLALFLCHSDLLVLLLR